MFYYKLGLVQWLTITNFYNKLFTEFHTILQNQELLLK